MLQYNGTSDTAATRLLFYDYDFNNDGSLKSLKDTYFDGSEKSSQYYRYDLSGRIAGAGGFYFATKKSDGKHYKAANYNESYTFDAADRMTSKTSTECWNRNLQGAYTYDNYNYRYEYADTSTHAVSKITITNSSKNYTEISFGYDDYGNLLTKKTKSGNTEVSSSTFKYDSNNKLTHIDLPDAGKVLDFMYDNGGSRIYKKYSFGTTAQSRIIFVNGFYNVYLETAGNKISKHISDGQNIIATKVDNKAENILYYSQNNIGSTVLLTDKDGDEIAAYLYKPFGEMWAKEDGPDTKLIDTNLDGIDDRVDRLFTGQMYDKESKLYYYNARYYDPNTGSFLTADPAMSGNNHYGYASANPIKYTDPTGMDDEDGGTWNNDYANSLTDEGSTTVSNTTTSTATSTSDGKGKAGLTNYAPQEEKHFDIYGHDLTKEEWNTYNRTIGTLEMPYPLTIYSPQQARPALGMATYAQLVDICRKEGYSTLLGRDVQIPIHTVDIKGIPITVYIDITLK